MIYPIPSIDGMVYLENLDGRNTLEVFSLIGDLVYQQITNSQTETLNLLNYPSGYYFVKITDVFWFLLSVFQICYLLK